MMNSSIVSDFHFSFNQWSSILHPTIFENLTKFGTARNPYDRVISLHLWKNNGVFNKELLMAQIKKYAFLLFNEFNPCSYHLSRVVSFDMDEDEFSAYKKESSVHVECPIELKNECAFFLRYETQLNQETMDQLCDALQINRSQLLHLNKNRRKQEQKHYSLYYDDELYELVTEAYETDLSLFEYEFEDKR